MSSSHVYCDQTHPDSSPMKSPTCQVLRNEALLCRGGSTRRRPRTSDRAGNGDPTGRSPEGNGDGIRHRHRRLRHPRWSPIHFHVSRWWNWIRTSTRRVTTALAGAPPCSVDVFICFQGRDNWHCRWNHPKWLLVQSPCCQQGILSNHLTSYKILSNWGEHE